jgi:hypothetical protein
MAINFPSTAGQATDGTFTYVVAGITYSWNGESWTAAGSGATATDLTVFSVTNTVAAGGGLLAYNNNSGEFTFTPPDLSSYISLYGSVNNHSDVTITNPQADQVLKYNSSNLVWENANLSFAVNDLSDTDIDSGGFNPLSDGDLLQWNASQSKWINDPNARSISSTNGAYFAVGGGALVQIEGLGAGGTLEISNGGHPVALSFDYNTGVAGQVVTATGNDGLGNATGATWSTPATPLQSRSTAQITATSLAPGAAANVSINTPKAYALLKVETSAAAWVTLYTDTGSRTGDASRSETTDPTPGSGVIAEVITNGAVTQLISPGTIAYNSTGVATTYLKVVNKGVSTSNIQVTLHYIQIEA